MIFHSSFSDGIFSEQLKVAKVSPMFKADSIQELENYIPILVLPIFFKVLERIMHNIPHQYFKEYNMIFLKQFGF